MAHDVRRNDRTTAQAVRLILTLKDEQPEAAWAVIGECRDNPAQLRALAVAAGALAAAFLTEEDVVKLAEMAADKLAGGLPGGEAGLG